MSTAAAFVSRKLVAEEFVEELVSDEAMRSGPSRLLLNKTDTAVVFINPQTTY